MKKIFTIIITAALIFGVSAKASCGIFDDNSGVLATIQLKDNNDPALEAEFGPKPTKQFAGLVVSATRKYHKNFIVSDIKWDEAYSTKKALIEDGDKVAIGWVVPYYGFNGKPTGDNFEQWYAIFKDNVLVAIHSSSDNELKSHSLGTLIMMKKAKYYPKGSTFWVREEKAITPDEFAQWQKKMK